MADVEYVPLETNDSCLIQNVTAVSVDNDRIVVADAYNGAVFVFDRSGRYLNTIYRQGAGPEEYRYISQLVIDMDNQEVIVYDTYANRLIRYGFDGAFHGDATLQRKGTITQMSNFGDSSLIAYDATDLTLKPKEDNADLNRYILINKTDGRITPVQLEVKHPRGDLMLWELESGGTTAIALNFNSLYQAGHGKAVISDITLDTVYCYDGCGFTPMFVNKNVDATSYAVPDIVTLEIPGAENAFFQYIRVLGINQNGVDVDEDKSGLYRYNYADGSISRTVLKNPNLLEDGGELNLGGGFGNAEGNIKCVALPTEKLLEELENNNLSEPVRRAVEGREPDANPVLMLVKFL